MRARKEERKSVENLEISQFRNEIVGDWYEKCITLSDLSNEARKGAIVGPQGVNDIVSRVSFTLMLWLSQDGCRQWAPWLWNSVTPVEH